MIATDPIRNQALREKLERPCINGAATQLGQEILGQVEDLQPFQVIGTVTLWVAVIAATISGVEYYRRFARSGL